MYFSLNYNEFLDDEERLREELKDLIDDNPEESDAESDASGTFFTFWYSTLPVNILTKNSFIMQVMKSVRNQMMKKIWMTV